MDLHLLYQCIRYHKDANIKNKNYQNTFGLTEKLINSPSSISNDCNSEFNINEIDNGNYSPDRINNVNKVNKILNINFFFFFLTINRKILSVELKILLIKIRKEKTKKVKNQILLEARIFIV